MLGGVEEHVKVDEKNAMLTDPDEAAEFVHRTGCDSLAVAIGTSHGAYKFKGTQSLHFDRLAEIQQRLPGFPLVMHGSSSVPPDEVQRINAAGGKLDPRPGRQRRRVCPGRAAGRGQGQHRHRRPAGVDPRPPRVFPRSTGKV